jgi:hypothetical protein
MPCSGTSPVLTFNLTNTLAESADSSDALFWLTVWLTVKRSLVRAAINAIQTQRFYKLGPWTSALGPRTGVTGAVSLSALDFIEGWGKISDKNMFLLDRPFPATPDFRVFGENVALGRGHVL